MENLDTNELIEQYLAGALSPADRQAVDTRLATDTAFRAEMEWQRQLYAELADSQKLQLRDLLSDIVQQPLPPSPTANYMWLKGLGIALLVLVVVWLGWLWFSLTEKPATIPPVQQEIKPSAPSIAPVDSTEIHKDSLPKSPELIAMNDPAAFATNRDFEARLGSNIRAADGSADMQSPTLGANFTPQNGFVKINFRGTVPADGDTTLQPLTLKIYSNQAPSSQPLFRVLPTISNRSTANGKWTFATAQRLRLRPGLYYFTMERQTDEDLIFVGKFTVGAR